MTENEFRYVIAEDKLNYFNIRLFEADYFYVYMPNSTVVGTLHLPSLFICTNITQFTFLKSLLLYKLYLSGLK